MRQQDVHSEVDRQQLQVCVQVSQGAMRGHAYPEVLLLQIVHHGVHSRREHGPVVLVVGIGLVYGALGFAAHTFHVLLVLLLNVLYPDIVDAVKQRNLQPNKVFDIDCSHSEKQEEGGRREGGCKGCLAAAEQGCPQGHHTRPPSLATTQTHRALQYTNTMERVCKHEAD